MLLPGNSQLLSFLPVPDHNSVIIINSHRDETLPIGCGTTEMKKSIETCSYEAHIYNRLPVFAILSSPKKKYPHISFNLTKWYILLVCYCWTWWASFMLQYVLFKSYFFSKTAGTTELGAMPQSVRSTTAGRGKLLNYLDKHRNMQGVLGLRHSSVPTT